MPPKRPPPRLSPALREPVKQELLQRLRDLAQQNATITYGELVAQLTTAELGHRDPALFELLCEISRDEANAGRGMLSVVVVRKKDQRQGDKFFDLAAELGRDVTNRDAFRATEMKLVHTANAAPRRS